jgi:hypothetical protein
VLELDDTDGVAGYGAHRTARDYRESSGAVSVTGARPPLPGGALSSAHPVMKVRTARAATATTRIRIRVVVARIPPDEVRAAAAALAVAFRSPGSDDLIVRRFALASVG